MKVVGTQELKRLIEGDARIGDGLDPSFWETAAPQGRHVAAWTMEVNPERYRVLWLVEQDSSEQVIDLFVEVPKEVYDSLPDASDD